MRSRMPRCGSWIRRLLALAPLGLPALASAQADPPDPLPSAVVVARTLDAPLSRVRSVLMDLERFGDWFPSISEWSVLSRDGDSAVVYGRQSFPWPVRDRDYVVRYRWSPTGAEVFLLTALALADAAPRSPPRTVRAEDFRTEWRLEPTGAAGAQTLASYRYEGRDEGLFLRWAARLGWRSGAQRVLDGLAEELARRVDE